MIQMFREGVPLVLVVEALQENLKQRQNIYIQIVLLPAHGMGPNKTL